MQPVRGTDEHRLQCLAESFAQRLQAVQCSRSFGIGVHDDAEYATIMEFIEKCMTGCETSAFLGAVRSRQAGGKTGSRKFGDLVLTGEAVVAEGSEQRILQLLQGFYGRHVRV